MDNIFSKFINNKINIQRLEKFAVIIGENPSKTARSPLLWNAAFRANKLNYSMVPLDVSKKNLVNVLNALKKNKDFIGGSVTVPYKIDIAKWLKDNLTIEAKNIGAVNCLYKNKDEVLKGTNTDGEASLISFKKKFGEINNKNILVLGCGGAGKAVLTYFSNELKNGRLYLSSRNEIHSNYLSKLDNVFWINWDEKKKILDEIDIIINCTSIGFNDQIEMSPISKDNLSKLKKDSIVYDIIYNPKKTQLLRFAEENGYKIFNGLEMNLLQAVLAFNYAVKLKNNNTEQAMREITKN